MEEVQQIQKDKVVEIHYTLKDSEGIVLDSSEGRPPLAFLCGSGSIIPGLESALTGKKPGDTLDVVVKPEDGYGERAEEAIQQMPREAFEGIEDLEVGMQLQADTEEGPVPITVVKITDDLVEVDGNHVLAGVTLYFSVSVESVRNATKEEIDHGHVH
jgi:FKBP-type peptidyl-prolyl cis-trans isomerase SlyD